VAEVEGSAALAAEVLAAVALAAIGSV
jgi:hypothetical protein